MSLYSYDYAWFLNYHHEFELFGKSLLVPHMQIARRQPSHSFKRLPVKKRHPVQVATLLTYPFYIKAFLR